MENDERVKATGRVFHLTPEPVWQAQQHAAFYLPEAYDVDGFVHCTGDEMLLMAVADRYYRGDSRPYLVLEIDLTHTRSTAVYEDADRHYPHVYGPIEVSAVTGVRRVLRDEDGTFVALGESGELTAR